MENPFITVLLCTYNDEKFITKTIESILNQSFKDFEFLIVNDGSTDNTLDIIMEFTDDRIVVINKENTGLTNSLNIGVSASKGKWIARIDGDDIAKPNRLEEQIKFLTDGIAVVGSQCEFIDRNGNILSKSYLPLNHNKILQNGLSFNTMMIHPSVIINKEKLLAANLYDPLMEAAEDFDLWLKISTLGKLVNVDKILLQYRLHSDKISYKKRNLQVQNTLISIAKYKKKIYRNITENEYKDIWSNLENNSIFLFMIWLSVHSVKRTGVALKLFNLLIKTSLMIIKKSSIFN